MARMFVLQQYNKLLAFQLHKQCGGDDLWSFM